MPILQQPIQRKLSSLLGADVTFENLHFSILGGSIEASGMTVSAAADMPPVLKIARLSAQVAVARALKGELVVSSMKIEKPAITIFRRSDGKTNLPRRDRANRETARPADRDESGPSRWQLDAEDIQLTDGSITIIDESPGADRYALSASPLSARLSRAGAGYELNLELTRIERADIGTAHGPLRAHAQFDGAAALSRLAMASLDGQLEIERLLTAKINSPRLDSKSAEVQCHGGFPAEQILALLPPALIPARLANLHGQIQLDLTARIDPHMGLSISDLNLRGTQIGSIG